MCERCRRFYALSIVTYFSPCFWSKERQCLLFALLISSSGMSNAICDLVLYLLCISLNILTYDGTSPLQYYKNSSGNARFYSFRDWEPIYFLTMNRIYVRARGRSKDRDMHLLCVTWSLYFRFLLTIMKMGLNFQSCC